jgi:hypothetical protein
VSRDPGHEFSRQLRTLSPEPGTSHHAKIVAPPPHGGPSQYPCSRRLCALPDTELVLLGPVSLRDESPANVPSAPRSVG